MVTVPLFNRWDILVYHSGQRSGKCASALKKDRQPKDHCHRQASCHLTGKAALLFLTFSQCSINFKSFSVSIGQNYINCIYQ